MPCHHLFGFSAGGSPAVTTGDPTKRVVPALISDLISQTYLPRWLCCSECPFGPPPELPLLLCVSLLK